MVGSMHNTLSRAQYKNVSTLMLFLGVDLPGWTTLWRARTRIRAMLNMDLNSKQSVLNNQCYSLKLRQVLALVGYFLS
jgi:hypothetical protein